MKHHEKSHHNLNVDQSKQIFGAHSYEINKKVMVNFCLKMAQNHNFSQLIFMEVFCQDQLVTLMFGNNL